MKTLMSAVATAMGFFKWAENGTLYETLIKQIRVYQLFPLMMTPIAC